MLSEAEVNQDEVDTLARRLHLHCIQTSVKDNLNIDAVFTELAAEYICMKRDRGVGAADLANQPVISLKRTNQKVKNCSSCKN